jgi:hypothetical protein
MIQVTNERTSTAVILEFIAANGVVAAIAEFGAEVIAALGF